MTTPPSLRIPTSRARERLAEIVARVQDPRAFCILTRHGKPVAAVVSMAEMRRIWDAQDLEEGRSRGWSKAWPASMSGTSPQTDREAGEMLQRMQMDRAAERRMLARAGLEPVAGGEVAVEGVAAVKAPRWWERFMRR